MDAVDNVDGGAVAAFKHAHQDAALAVLAHKYWCCGPSVTDYVAMSAIGARVAHDLIGRIV